MRQERGATGSARRASAPPSSVSVLVFATIGAYGGVRRLPTIQPGAAGEEVSAARGGSSDGALDVVHRLLPGSVRILALLLDSQEAVRDRVFDYAVLRPEDRDGEVVGRLLEELADRRVREVLVGRRRHGVVLGRGRARREVLGLRPHLHLLLGRSQPFDQLVRLLLVLARGGDGEVGPTPVASAPGNGCNVPLA